jgi:hypothetical protein
MASFSAYLHLGGKVYEIAYCYYEFRQYIDYKGRPRSKVYKGPIVVEIRVVGVYEELTAWAADDHKTLSGYIEFMRPDTREGVLGHLWFTHAWCVGFTEDFESTGTTGLPSLRLTLTISPEDMGREAGSGTAWVAPAARAYTYKPPVAAPTPHPLASILTAPPVVSAAVLAGPKPAKNTPEGIAWRWAKYEAKMVNDPKIWPYQRWIKQTLTNHQNCEFGLSREAQYQAAMGGISKTLKTGYTNRQVDIYIKKKDYCGQLKTGKLSLGKQQLTDLKRDEWLISRGLCVEYILEKGGSKPLLKELARIGASVKIGPQIP